MQELLLAVARGLVEDKDGDGFCGSHSFILRQFSDGLLS